MLATRRQGWRGLVGRANGGMIVHLGVILIAVALVASNSYTRSATLNLPVGAGRRVGRAHVRAAARCASVEDDRVEAVKADVLLDGEQVYAPAITTYLRMGDPVSTPSVRTGLDRDVYLTLEPGADAGRRRRRRSACSSSR